MLHGAVNRVVGCCVVWYALKTLLYDVVYWVAGWCGILVGTILYGVLSWVKWCCIMWYIG